MKVLFGGKLGTLLLLVLFTYTQLAIPYAQAAQHAKVEFPPGLTVTVAIDGLKRQIASLRDSPDYDYALWVFHRSERTIDYFHYERGLTVVERALLRLYVNWHHNPLGNALAMAANISEVAGEPKLKEAVLVTALQTKPDEKIKSWKSRHNDPSNIAFLDDVIETRWAQFGRNPTDPTTLEEKKRFGRKLILEKERELIRQYWTGRAPYTDNEILPESDEQVVTWVIQRPMDESEIQFLVSTISSDYVPQNQEFYHWPLRDELTQSRRAVWQLIKDQGGDVSFEDREELVRHARAKRLSNLNTLYREMIRNQNVLGAAEWRVEVVTTLSQYLGTSVPGPSIGYVLGSRTEELVRIRPDLSSEAIENTFDEVYDALVPLARPRAYTECLDSVRSSPFSPEQEDSLLKFFYLLDAMVPMDPRTSPVTSVPMDSQALLAKAKQSSGAQEELRVFKEYLQGVTIIEAESFLPRLPFRADLPAGYDKCGHPTNQNASNLPS